jgi:hypothetical protein
MSTLFCATRGVIDCNDPYSILIFSILSLGDTDGSLPENILTEAQVLCPETTADWTQPIINSYISLAVKRGLLVIATPTTFAVNARMALVNPINTPYFCIGQLFKC